MKIALDCFGGDSGPEVNIRGTLDFLKESQAEVILTGPEGKIKELLQGAQSSRIHIVDAPEVLDMAEKPSSQLRRKTNSSMYKAIELVSHKKADACVSAGSSAAMMALSVLLLKRLGDVERPALLAPFPTLKSNPTFCLDMGANVDCKPIHLVQFALMGHAFVQAFENKDKPRIGLLSNGEEEGKGNELSRATHEILKSVNHINYGGYCEGNDLFTGDWDVVVCDGFVGNIVLKTAEGLSEALMHLIKEGFSSSVSGMLGYMIAKGSLRPLKKKLDYAQYGGAPLLGIQGLSLICHGRSNSLAIKNALHAAENNHKHRLVERMQESLSLLDLTKVQLNPQEGQGPHV